MNKEIAMRRYRDVLRPDVVNNSQGDFLATHVPMKNLYLTDHAELSDQDRKSPMTEEEVYELVLPLGEEDQFVLVKGASGAGKSHLIRWFYTMLELRKSDSEIVLFIRRADNTLKGTIRQLVELPEVRNLPNRELYKKLTSASTRIPEKELKNTIYYNFITLIESDDGTAGNGEERMISNVDRKHLITLLQNVLFKGRMMAESGPVDRIYNKFAENKSLAINDEAAEFRNSDFVIDSVFRDKLIEDGADLRARKIADRMVWDGEFVKKLVNYMNLFVEKVIQRCTGLEPGDLSKVIEEIRQELFSQGKSLIILIEDITAVSGVDESLLDALLTDRNGYPDKKMCRMNAIVGTTDGYYIDKFKTNIKGRIKRFVNVPDDLFNGDQMGLIEFFARYLNVISLEEETINKWIAVGADANQYPVHTVTIGEGWGKYRMGEKELNLFPFSEHAILYLYNKQDINKRNPRALMREILEPYLAESLENLHRFPVRRVSLEGVNPNLQNTVYNRTDLEDSIKLRLVQFMYIWGDGTNHVYEEDGIRYIGGISEQVYTELGLPIIDGRKVEKSVVEHAGERQAEEARKRDKEIGSTFAENEQVTIALKEVDRWIEDTNYKLNVGATTKSVRALNDARKNMNDYLYEVIDWLAEGVPLDVVNKVKETSGAFLVAFERQTTESKTSVILPASIESRKIIEAFVRWSEVGKKSWDFPGSTDYLYRVQCWSERIKPDIIKAITQYNGKIVNYFSYAVAAEFYRLILNGYCKNYENPHNLDPDLLLRKSPPISTENGHTKAWNDLRNMVNGSDGEKSRSCVLQYCNLPQGTKKASSNYEMEYTVFNRQVKKVINTGLHYAEEELQLDDPVRKRKEYSEYLKKIQDRIVGVIQEEESAIYSKLDVMRQLVDLEALDEDVDIKEVIKEIKRFYEQADKSHIRAAIHNRSDLIGKCQKNAGMIVKSIKEALYIRSIEEPVEKLIRLSKDPLKNISIFAELLSIVYNDVRKTDQEIETRMSNVLPAGDNSAETKYAREQAQIRQCRENMEEVKIRHANG